MYVSGQWKGFWQQTGWGRQPMEQFALRFQKNGQVTGQGVDAIGPFVVAGTYDPSNGGIEWVKQYLGRHQVHYVGQPDGEGRIVGAWAIGGTTGPFSLQPVVADDLPILEITR